MTNATTTATTTAAMTVAEIRQAIIDARDTYASDYRFLGFRFAMEDYVIGSVVEQVSRSNANRQDERDFPAYGSDEYEELEELDGLCAYLLDKDEDYLDELIQRIMRGYRDDMIYTPNHYTPHIYIMGTDEISHSWAEDYGEVILPDPTVISKII